MASLDCMIENDRSSAQLDTTGINAEEGTVLTADSMDFNKKSLAKSRRGGKRPGGSNSTGMDLGASLSALNTSMGTGMDAGNEEERTCVHTVDSREMKPGSGAGGTKRGSRRPERQAS